VAWATADRELRRRNEELLLSTLSCLGLACMNVTIVADVAPPGQVL
jgi:hypothetical protein